MGSASPPTGAAPGLPPGFEALIDDAAVFPPGNAPMRAAVAAHLARRDATYAALVGRFLCPASRLGELEAAHPPGSPRLELGLIADTGPAGLPEAIRAVERSARLTLAQVEIPIPPGADLEAAARVAVSLLPDVEGYVELPIRPGAGTGAGPVGDWRQALRVLADSRFGAKLRTGGLAASAFPTVDDVARFVVACVAAEVPFKCTGGLHHALAHTDPATGFAHHGFLNLLLAAYTATQGGDVADCARVLAEREAAPVLARLDAAGDVGVVVARSFFLSFGSCSIEEPVADLVALGLLEPGDAA